MERASRAWRYGLILVVLIGLALAWLPAPQPILGRALLRNLWWLAQTLALLALPGLALIALLRPLEDSDPLQTACLALVTSLALFPLLLFWMGLAGGRWTASGARVLLGISAAILLWPLWRGSLPFRPAFSSPAIRYTAAFGLLFAAAIGVGLWVVRGIAYPAWVDSYHHTIITQLVLERGRVPTDYHPYANLDSLLYHFGYHSYSAFLAWVTGLPAHRAVLWGGQILSALTIPSLFFFVDRVGRDRRAALVAALVGGLLCRMPAYYVNWGRYPQLAGQVLLPVALALTVDATRSPRPRWGAVVLAGILVAGLGLTHYRIMIFYLVGLIILAVTLVVRGRDAQVGVPPESAPWERQHSAGSREQAANGSSTSPDMTLPTSGGILWERRQFWRRQPWRSGLRLGALGAIALVLILPWLPSLLNKTVSTARQVLATSNGTQYDHLTLDFILGYGLQAGILLASLASALWLLLRVRAKPLGALVLLWLGLIIFLANPNVSGMPNGFLVNGTVVVGLYLPAALVIGLAVGDIWDQIERAVKRRAQDNSPIRPSWEIILLAGMLVLSGWGVRDKLAHGIEPWRYLVSKPDEQAMQWAREHTPEDALFAIGTDFWLEEAATGNDAGFWLPYIARRQTTIPPMIYINEADPQQIAATNAALQQLNASDSPAALAQALRTTGASYVYLGNRMEQRWREALSDPQFFETIYSIDGVTIYRLR